MRAQRLSALAVGALAAFGTVPCVAGAASAASPAPASGVTSAAAAPNDAATELVVDSAASNSLFHGVSGVWTASGRTFQVGGSQTYVSFAVDGIPGPGGSALTLSGRLAAPSGAGLTPGATYSGSDVPQPPISLLTGAGSCGPQESTFKVDQLTVGGGTVTSAEIEFTADCGAPLHGLLRYHATGPAPPGAPTGVPIDGVPGVPGGTAGPISFQRDGAILADPGPGADGVRIAAAPAADTRATLQTWSPLGSRLLVAGDQGLVSVRPDGSAPIPIANPSANTVPVEATITPDGSTVVYANGAVYAAATDGSGAKAADHRLPVPGPDGGPAGTTPFLHPRFTPDGALLLTGTDQAYQHPSLYRYTNGATKLVVANADWGTPSADGTRIAFIRADAAGVRQLFVVGADGTSGLTQLTHGTDDVSEPAWSPDGTYLAYSDDAFHEVVEIDARSGAHAGSIPNASSPVWTPPVVDSHVVREWGADRVSTAVAASQLNFADHGAADKRRVTAGAVVLSRGDTFADALGGSALAVRKNAPLLITGTGQLDPAVKAEIRRVLPPGGTVYLLGGTAALSPAVASALSGYHVVRLAGEDRYATAVNIAQQISANPHAVLVATGDDFPDALAAGAVGEPVLLTSGTAMPKATAAYLNTLNPNPSAAGGTEIVTVGGPGATALHTAYLAGRIPSWPKHLTDLKLTGADRYATALLVAKTFFAGDRDAAVATGDTWPDALSGGAMVGHRGGPLLLTAPTGITPDVLTYLGNQSASLFALHLLGGPAALPDAIAHEAAAAIGVPGHVVLGALTPGGPYPLAGTVPKAATTGGAGKAPGLVGADDTSWAAIPVTVTSED
ncbi:MAG: hypothetical protein HOW97_41115 [Catenulispora sp.]|nr:hypothetical protein [Catenulispora sp.]